MSKFNDQVGGAYQQNYFKADTELRLLICEHFEALRNHGAGRLRGLDIGAGPGCGAALLHELNISCLLIRWEPSNLHFEGERFSETLDQQESCVTYMARKGTLKTVADSSDVSKVDFILFLRCIHEIAADMKDREEFFRMLSFVIGRFLKSDGLLIIAEPQYADSITSQPERYQAVIDLVREFQQQNLGHAHYPHDYITHQELCDHLAERGLVPVKKTFVDNPRVKQYVAEKGLSIEMPTTIFYCITFHQV